MATVTSYESLKQICNDLYSILTRLMTSVEAHNKGERNPSQKVATDAQIEINLERIDALLNKFYNVFIINNLHDSQELAKLAAKNPQLAKSIGGMLESLKDMSKRLRKSGYEAKKIDNHIIRLANKAGRKIGKTRGRVASAERKWEKKKRAMISQSKRLKRAA